MSFFTEVEKTIERAFRKWTDRAFGPAQSDELLLVHRAILEQIESKIQVIQRGRHLFPYNYLRVRLISPDPERRALFQAAFAQERRLENDIREALQGAACELPPGFTVEVETAAEGEKGFEIEYDIREAPAPAQASVPALAPEPVPAASARLVTTRGKAVPEEFALAKARINIGRMPELTDSEQRVVRRNHMVFEEGGDDANATVSRAHAHILYESEGAEYRICDDGSEFGTRIFRDGKSIEVPAGNRRGERLRPGDEIYLGRACLRFEL
jgi:hypothetical protein